MEYNKGFSNVYGNNIPDRSFFSRENGDVIFVRPMMNHIIEIKKEGVFSLFELKGKNMLTLLDAQKLYDSYSTKDLQNRDHEAISKINKYTRYLSYIENRERIIIEMSIGRTLNLIMINKRTDEICIYNNVFNDVFYREQDRSIIRSVGCTDSNGVYYRTSSFISNGVAELQKFYTAGMLSPDVIGLEKIMELKDDDNPILLYYEFKE